MSDKRVNPFFLKQMAGEILRIEDPRNHSTEAILQSFFLEILLMARSFTRTRVEFEDLVMEGLMGLLDAIERWDPERRTNERSFHNLAILRIKSYMYEYFLSNNFEYKVPVYMAKAMLLVDRMSYLLYEVGGTDWDIEEVMGKFLCLEFEDKAPKPLIHQVHELKQKLLALADSSDESYENLVQKVLAARRNIMEYERETSAATPTSLEEESAREEFLDKFLRGIQSPTREIMQSLLQGSTLKEAGQACNLTGERARQLKEEALKDLYQTRLFREPAGR